MRVENNEADLCPLPCRTVKVIKQMQEQGGYLQWEHN